MISKNFNFPYFKKFSNFLRILRGQTKFIEFNEFQKELRDVFVYFNDPDDLVIEADQTSVTRVFVSSIDVNEAPAREESAIYVTNRGW